MGRASGKTELAKAFGRWWRDTGGVERPEWVIWHSFEPGVDSFGLDGILTTIGLQIYGPDFARCDAVERRTVVSELLSKHRVLVVLDNFETVHSMPDQSSAPLLDDGGREKLRDFLAEVASAGPSTVLITSRSPERWLGEVRRILLDGLSTEEASEYADQLLAAYPKAKARRAQRAFGELLAWLDGNPLSMRLTLPLVDTIDPADLLDGLRGVASLADPDGGDRSTSLPACITYSITHLDPTARRLLAAVCLFHGVADVIVVGQLANEIQVPDRFRDIGNDTWAEALDGAAGVGLLTPLGAGLYGIHPALPSYLVGQWRREDPDGYANQRAAADIALLCAYAEFSRLLNHEIVGGHAESVYARIDWHRRTFGRLLGIGLDGEYWSQLHDIIITLAKYWKTRGLLSEAVSWTDRVRLVIESPDGSPPSFDTSAGKLWLSCVWTEAHSYEEAGQFEMLRNTQMRVRDALLRLPPSPDQREALAICYRWLGLIAERLDELDEAEHWCHLSLYCEETRGPGLGMAGTYQALARIAHYRGQQVEATEWCRKSLRLNQKVGSQVDISVDYDLLGLIADAQEKPEEAEEWFQKSLDIKMRLGDRPGIAESYLHLGDIAYYQGRLDEAEEYYGQSLYITEATGDRHRMVKAYQMLGSIAYRHGRLHETEEWRRRSLTIYQSLGDRFGAATACAQLSQLREKKGYPQEALSWMIRAVTAFEEFPHQSVEPISRELARWTAILGVDALRHCWLEVTGHEPPAEVISFVEASYQKES